MKRLTALVAALVLTATLAYAKDVSLVGCTEDKKTKDEKFSSFLREP